MNEHIAESVDATPPPLPPTLPPLIAPAGTESPERLEQLGLPLFRQDRVALVLLTILADVCLYGVAGGTGGAVLLLATFVALLVLKRLPPAERSLKAGGVILALAAILVWSAWWLAVVVAALSLFPLAVRLWRPEWTFLECLWGAVESIVRAPFRLFGHAVAGRQAFRKTGTRPLPVRVVLIPLAVTVLFLIVFAAANPVVSRGFTKLWTSFADFLTNLSDYLNVPRFFFWCGWLLVFAALIRPAVRSVTINRLLALDVGLKPREMVQQDQVNFQVACVTLVCVNVVFLGYNGMDAVYLYFKRALPAGITWTAYTHEGCGWLTFGLFLSTVVLGFIFWDEHNFHEGSGRLKGLAYVWIAQNALLAGGTLRRVCMYIDYSGLTHLLLTGVYGSLLVMAGLGIMAVKVRSNHNAVWLLRRYVAAFAVGIVALALTPQGWVCATYNVARIQAEKPHALWPVCLKELPADALPALIPLLDYHRQDGDRAKEKLVREGMAALLGQSLARLEREDAEPWTRWQASSWWALKRLRPVRERIQAIVAPDQWAEVWHRLKADYDLTASL